MNLAYAMNDQDMERGVSPQLIKHLEDRIKALEKFISQMKYDQVVHPSDLAAQWRRRLAALGSHWIVLTMDSKNKPKIGRRYKIIRVEQSDPEFFIVTERGNRESGMMYHKDEIEKLISQKEAEQGIRKE